MMLTRNRPAPKISTPGYIGTGDFHNPTSSQSYRPVYLYLVCLMVIARVSPTGTGIPVGRVGSINNGTDINAVASEAIRYANWGLNGRTGEMLIKKLRG